MCSPWFRSFSPPTSSDLNSFFVVTTIYNPAGYTSRYELYHKFARHMKDFGVQLLTVEAIFPSLGQTTFAVTQPDNPLHVQIISNSVYWMKENLINIGVARLPSHTKWVAWLDADITFESKNWVKEIITALKKYEIVQVFKKAKFLGPSPASQVLRTDYSFGYSVIHQKPIDQTRYDEWYPHPGYGWAMSLLSFQAIGGLPIYDICGSADLHFAFSLLNRVTNALETQLHPEFKAYIEHASHDTFQTLAHLAKQDKKSGIVGYIPVNIRHNWHGSRSDRGYMERWKILIAHQFNFKMDVAINPENGLLEFVGPKRFALQADILAYFGIRKEDGICVTGEDLGVVDKTTKKKTIKKTEQTNVTVLPQLDHDDRRDPYWPDPDYPNPDPECPDEGGDNPCQPGDDNNCTYPDYHGISIET